MPAKMKTGAILFLILSLFAVLFSAAPSQNVVIAVKFISYHNYNGTIATGQCCDEPRKSAGSCSEDLCDTAFDMCVTSQGSSTSCDMFRKQSTSTTYNNNSLEFGSRMGNEIASSSTNFVLKSHYEKGNAYLTIKANEMGDKNESKAKVEIAKYNITIDWIDPVHDSKSIYRRFVLNDTHAQLVVDVVFMCDKRYFTQNCSLHCESKCFDNGTNECLAEAHCKTNLSMPISTKLTTTPLTRLTSSVSTKMATTTSIKPTSTKMATTTSTKPMSTKIGSWASTETSTDVATKDTSSGSKPKNTSVSPVDGDGDDTAGLAAGVSVGVLFLLLLIVVSAYFVYKKNRRGQVTPEEKTHSSTENEVSGSEKNEDAQNNINITLTQSVGDTDQKHTFISGQHPSVETAL